MIFNIDIIIVGELTKAKVPKALESHNAALCISKINGEMLSVICNLQTVKGFKCQKTAFAFGLEADREIILLLQY